MRVYVVGTRLRGVVHYPLVLTLKPLFRRTDGGRRLHGSRTEGAMAEDIPLDRQRPAQFVFERNLATIGYQVGVDERGATRPQSGPCTPITPTEPA